ncbi:hypothetical protein [Lacipirellula limnantheis]|nr:hypothetical protein [Lacipirellula limnantheis]
MSAKFDRAKSENPMNLPDKNEMRHAYAVLQFEEAEALIWDLLDETLDEAGVARLSKLLEEDAALRSRFVECVQLHVDLHEHFGQQTLGGKQPSSGETVLSDLPGLAGLPGFPTVIQ